VAPAEAPRAAADDSARDPHVIVSLPGGDNDDATTKISGKLARRARTRDTLTVLAEWFPGAFSSPPRPLRIGVRDDLLARASAISPGELREALARWTSALAYQRALVEGAVRVDLDGEPAGAVTAGEAAHARERIVAIKAKLRERRQASGRPILSLDGKWKRQREAST
jgi:ProP effector